MMRMFLIGGVFLIMITMKALAQEAEPPPFDYAGARGMSNYSCALARDGKTLAVGGMHAFLGIEGCRGGWILWDMSTGKRLQAAGMEGGASHSMALAPDGKLLAVGGNDSELRLFDVPTGSSLAVLPGHRGCLNQVVFSADGKCLVTVAADNMIRVWSVADRRALATYRFTSKNWRLNLWKELPELPFERAQVNVTFEKPVERAYQVAITPDCRTMAVTAGTNEVMLLELLTGKVVRTIRLKDIDIAYSLAFSADGNMLAIGAGGDIERDTGKVSIELWDFAKAEHRLSLRGHRHSALCLAISPDKRTIISGGTEDGVRVWDGASAKQKFHLDSESRIVGLAFMPDGNSFLSVGLRAPAHFWDTATGKAVSPLKRDPSE